MKTLYIVRHSMAAQQEPRTSDHDRPLNSRGISDAQLMGRVLAEAGAKPGMIVSSTARRAVSTAMVLAPELDVQHVRHDARLYPGTVGDWMEVIHGLPASLHEAMLVGHNPGVESLIFHLSGRTPAGVPTSCVAAFTSGGTWADMSTKDSQLLYVDWPDRHRPPDHDI